MLDASADDGRESQAPIRMALCYINSNDGTSKTLMISESTRTWFYAYDGSSAGGDDTEYNVGFSQFKDTSPIRDTKHIWGFVWSNEPTGVERINGDRYYDQNPAPPSMLDFSELGATSPHLYESYRYPASNHPGGVNVAFCDGHIIFLRESIEPRVYAQLMTSNRNKSKYYDSSITPPNLSTDRKLPQPSDADL
jgi:prepilin-type processing-associated H-X9-DG protein